MTIITNLLMRPWSSPQELYKAFEKEHVMNYFTKVKTPMLTAAINEALDINDDLKTIKLKNYQAIFKLAELYHTGDLKSGVPINLHRYEICLAMVAMDEKSEIRDFRENLKALKLLRTFYQTHPKANVIVGDKSLMAIVDLKIEVNDQFTAATIVSSDRVVPSGKPFKDSHHIAQPVIYQTHADIKNSQTRYIRKHEVEARVAGIEVFCGTMMELFIGVSQPSTFQEEKQINGTVPILSEEINFKRFSDDDAFKAWVDSNFKHAAELDVACVVMADDDYSLRNGGLREDNGLPVRIDFDRMIAPISLKLIGQANQPKKQRINNTEYTSAGLVQVNGFAIHSDDFNNLPLLASKMPRPEIILNHYVPMNWWANNFASTPEVYAKIAALLTDPVYQEAKFRAILEKIILPIELIECIAEKTIFHVADKREVIEWMKERQLQLAAHAENITGLGAYIKTNGARALEALKTSFESFAAKRSDLKLPDKLILQEYQKNLGLLQSSLPDALYVDTRPAMHQPVHAESRRLFQFFEDIKSRNNKEAQRSYFVSQLPALAQDDLEALADYMQKVQLGLVIDHPFKMVRTERHPALYSSGNTNTWGAMRHAVKAEIISRLKHAYADDGKIILEAFSYDKYIKMLGQHTGRFFKRFGKTHSAVEFERHFTRAVNNQTPTASRFERKA